MDLVDSKDLRVIKTNRAIYGAFVDLVNEKGFAAVTVQDILDRALINRKTFYKYYQGKFDLAERVGAAFLQEFDGIVQRRLGDCCGDVQPMAYVESVYRELYDRKDEIRAIWSIRTDRIDVLEEVRARLRGVYLRLADDTNAKGDTGFQAAMFASLVTSSYQHVMEGNRPFEAHMLLNEYRCLYDVVAHAVGQGRPVACDQPLTA